MKLRSLISTISLAATIFSVAYAEMPFVPGHNTLALIVDKTQSVSWFFNPNHTSCAASQTHGTSYGIDNISCPATANGELVFFRNGLPVGNISIGNSPCFASATNPHITADARSSVCVIIIQ